MKQNLSPSRINSALTCMRQHYWRYERVLRKEEDSFALQFGEAWDIALQARWDGADYEGALNAALPDGNNLDAVAREQLAALLAGYWSQWGEKDTMVDRIYPQQKFKMPIRGSNAFQALGVIDGLGTSVDGEPTIIESKTTSEDLSPDSDYWMKLRFNTQVLNYVSAARAMGHEITRVIYDVTRKPTIRPAQIPLTDEHGVKIVCDKEGNRVLKPNGEPRQTGDKEKGWELQTRTENPEEYGERLWEDIRARPSFYFVRRDVPILDQDLEEFRIQRLVVGRTILGARSEERKAKRPEHAWPRNIGPACKWCAYAGFCLSNITPDLKNPPSGYKVGY